MRLQSERPDLRFAATDKYLDRAALFRVHLKNQGLIALDPGISDRRSLGNSAAETHLRERAFPFPARGCRRQRGCARTHSGARRRRPRATCEHVRRRSRVRAFPVTRVRREDRARAPSTGAPPDPGAPVSRLPRFPRRPPSSPPRDRAEIRDSEHAADRDPLRSHALSGASPARTASSTTSAARSRWARWAAAP